jgi:uncharacterized protein YjbJ (UPF0337 family)
MKRSQIEGRWEQVKGLVQEKWGELTEDDLNRIAGAHRELVGRVQARYGKTREEAEAEVDRWLDDLPG